MQKEIQYSIPIIVLLAVIFALASDYCRPIPFMDKTASFHVADPFNPFCYIDGFHPESPELSTTTTTTTNGNLSTISYSGTAYSSLGTTTVEPSPSQEIPENI